MAAIFTGGAAVVADTALNIEFIASNGGSAGMIATAVVIAGIGLVALPAGRLARVNGAGLLDLATIPMLVLALIYSMASSWSRVHQVLESVREAHNLRVDTLRDRHKSARTRVHSLQDRLQEEMRTGCGPRCRGWQEELKAALWQLKAARDEMLAAGPHKPRPSLATRLPAYVVPLLMPLAGFLLTAIGFLGLMAPAAGDGKKAKRGKKVRRAGSLREQLQRHIRLSDDPTPALLAAQTGASKSWARQVLADHRAAQAAWQQEVNMSPVIDG